ncbi:MAG TPA: HD domain-containing protein [Candidatus Faecousia intestinigallinarum]|nr:HD domain-containing protein [Candidatus Faecousia intestinigallinarum]
MTVYEQLHADPQVAALLEKGNADLGVLGFTDHSIAHTTLVAERAAYILRKLGFSEREQELAKIAGLLHDIGNAINRTHHAEYGALLAGELLRDKALTLTERVCVMSAIGNHDESTGGAKDPVSAALVLADKSDVRRNRVRAKEKEKFDIHDRVNYAVTGSSLKVDPEENKISLNLQVDEHICTMYEYFDIFLGRMMMCRGAAEMLGAKFRLTVNGGKVL